jgi:excisionase family DNA binding protein
MTEKYFTTAELAAMLGVTPQTIRNLRSSNPNSLPCAYRFGNMRRVLFRESDVAQFLKKNSVGSNRKRSNKN